MKEKDLLRAMSDIREDYILEASPDNLPSGIVPFRRRRNIRIITGIAAACFIGFISIGAWQLIHRESPNSGKHADNEAMVNTAGEAYEDDEAVVFEAPEQDGAAAEMMMEPEAETETETETEKETNGNIGKRK